MRFPLVNKMHCHRKQDVEQGLPKCARRLGGIPFKEGEKGEPSQGCVPQFLCTLLHEKRVKMPRNLGDLNAPESSIFYGIKIQGNVDIAGRSKTRPKSICTLQRSSQCTGAIRFRLSQQKIRMSLLAISQGTSSAVAAVAVESVEDRGGEGKVFQKHFRVF